MKWIFAQGRKVGIIVWENNNIYQMVTGSFWYDWSAVNFWYPFVIIRATWKIDGSIVSIP